MVIILMGVCGCGKTTIGERLAKELDWPYYDGDDFHPEANVVKMAQGVPLTDEDRFPWLRILAEKIGQWIAVGENAILGCSALRKKYREILVGDRPEVRIVHLKGTKELIQGRLQERVHRYMPAKLLDSQFEALEEPEEALSVDITPEPEIIAGTIRQALSI